MLNVVRMGVVELFSLCEAAMRQTLCQNKHFRTNFFKKLKFLLGIEICSFMYNIFANEQFRIKLFHSLYCFVLNIY